MLSFVLLVSALLGSYSTAQSSSAEITVTEEVARQHLLNYVAPVYPPIAKAAHVIGEVRLAITIDRKGRVSKAETLSGPAMLEAASIDAVKQWTFTSFDSPGPVKTEISVKFELPSPEGTPTKAQQQAEQEYFPLSDKCSNALRSGDHSGALNFCKQALEKAVAGGEFTDSDKLGITNAHQAYGHALLDAGKLQEALAEENTAVDEAKRCLTNTDQEYGMPFFWRAMVEAQIGTPDKALADMEIAEDSQRRAIKNLPDMKKIYSGYLASMLKRHASWLDQLGRHSEADKLRAEAASLQI